MPDLSQKSKDPTQLSESFSQPHGSNHTIPSHQPAPDPTGRWLGVHDLSAVDV